MKKLIQSTKLLVLSLFVLLLNCFNSFGQEPGNALDFDGINDYVQIGTSWQGQQMYNSGTGSYFYGDLYLYNSPFTIEAWIKPADVDGSTNQYEGIIINGANTNQLQYSILINRTGFASYKWFDAGSGTTKEIRTQAGSIINNRWQHIAVSKSGTTLNIYINGVRQTTTGDACTEGSITGGNVILGDGFSVAGRFKGQIDELHIWKDPAFISYPYSVVGGAGNLWCNLRFNALEGNNISTIGSVYNRYPSFGLMYNMDGNADRVESYAMVLPTLKNPTNNVNGGFTANWNAPVTGFVEKYYIEIATDPGMINKVPAYSPFVDAGNALSYTFAGLTQGQTYYYTVRAFKASVGDVGAYTPVSTIIMNIQEPGNALDFDGVDDYVQIGTSWQGQRMWNANSSYWFYGDLYLYNTAFTIEAWVKPSDADRSAGYYESIITNGNSISGLLQYSVLINRMGFVSYRWSDAGSGSTREISTSIGSLTNKRWQHIAVVKPGPSTVYIYINGVQQPTSGTPISEGNMEGGTVVLGNVPFSSPIAPFKGQIDELHIWKNQVRPPTLTTVGGEGNLFCNFRFNLLEGNTVSSVSSVTSSYPSNGVMYNMDGNVDRAESYAMVLPNISTPTNNECGKFTANWTAPASGTVEKYYLEIATDPGMINKVPAYSPYIDVGNVLSYTVTGLNYQTYFYRIRAYKSSVGDVGALTPVNSVNIVDLTNPVVITQDITVPLDETGNATITPQQIDNGSTDNCTIKSLSLDKTSFNCSNIGVNTVTLTVTDSKGNSATGTAIVTIPDNLIPVVGTITQPTLLVPSGSVSLSNLPPSGSWTITQSPGEKTTEGTGISTTISGLTTGSYTFKVTNGSGCTSGASAEVVIDAQPVKVTVDPDQSKIYGESDPVLSYSFTPALQSGDSFTGNLTRSAGEIPGSYAIGQGTLSAGSKYSIIFVPDDFTISPKPLTVTGVTATNKVYDGTTSVSLSGGVLSGVITGDEVALITGTGTFADPDAGIGKTINCSGYSLSGTDAAKYSLNQPEGVTADISKADPVISWSNPSAIVYGTALGATQLNASASIPGIFIYSPSSGTVLNAGVNQVLSLDFVPSDAVNYNNVNNTQVQITVNKATPAVTWSNPSAITYGIALSVTQLNASANVPGTFTYTPASGTVLNAGPGQTLSVSFAPADAANYTEVNTTQVQISVNKDTPVVTWNNPAAISYGTALSATQLNASANVPGTFTYTPASGTLLNAGASQILSVNFVPADAANYFPVSDKQVQITVNKADQLITFNALAEKNCGDDSFILDASSGSGLTVVYTSSDPAVASISGNVVTILKAGSVTVTALQPGNSNFNPAANVIQALVINELDNSVIVTGNLLTANASNVTYQWINCNNGNAPISGETNKTFSAETSGSYAVIITNKGCSVISGCYDIVITGMDENSFGEKFRLYPNPTSGNLTIDLAENYAEVEIIISDVNGRVSKRQWYYDTRKIDLTIDGPYGYYFITIVNKEGRRTILKVIKT